MNELPAVMAEIAEVAGLDAAWALAQAKGGQQVFIPAKVRPDHWLSKLVGFDAAQKICQHFSVGGRGDDILIPMASTARRNQALQRALAQGLKVNQAAAAAGVHRRTVLRHRKREKGAKASAASKRNKAQGDLF
ncbi:MAG TPA: helix-turn-helix domain-containing protein [Devosia sp.]|jgi:DNA-binding NarL/FixJ family response regulator|nr:helix-turn-helix domain-containing protein [Devosia sp.]